jgi:hypothetical protein
MRGGISIKLPKPKARATGRPLRFDIIKVSPIWALLQNSLLDPTYATDFGLLQHALDFFYRIPRVIRFK